MAAPNETYVTKSRQTDVSVTVHRSTASDFAPRKSDHNGGPPLEVKKPVQYLHLARESLPD